MAEDMKPDSNGSAGKVALALVRESLCPAMDRLEDSLDTHSAILAEVQAEQIRQGARLVTLEECNKEYKASRQDSGKVLRWLGAGGVIFLVSVIFAAGKVSSKIDTMRDTLKELHSVTAQMIQNIEALNKAQAEMGIHISYLAGSRALPEPTAEKVEAKRETMGLPRAPRIRTLD